MSEEKEMLSSICNYWYCRNFYERLKNFHGGFKLPVPLPDTSVSPMRTTSKTAEDLRKTKLIIIDEIAMLTK